jgi:hypothetical protein
MHAIIFYLTAFGYIDGKFDARRSSTSATTWASSSSAARAPASATSSTPLRRHRAHHRALPRGRRRDERFIEDLFTESVAEGESHGPVRRAKLKLRCFELFRRFDDHTRSELLASVDELMFADGSVAPERGGLPPRALPPADGAGGARADVEIDDPDELDADLDVVEPGAVIIGAREEAAGGAAGSPLLQGLRVPVRQGQGGVREAGAGSTWSSSIAPRDAPGAARRGQGQARRRPPISTRSPRAPDELLVIGDLHGCYSCLKAALLQADFFAKVRGPPGRPARHPAMKLVLLGDYIDRGRFSYNGVLRAAMQLFARGPEHVYLLRGNHEYYVELNGKVLAPVRPARP